MEYEYRCLKVERDGGLATVLMYWPDGIKKEPRQFHKELSDVLWRLRYDDEVRVVVLRGAGERYFLSHFPEEKSEEAVVSQDRYYEIINNSSPTTGILTDSLPDSTPGSKVLLCITAS